MKLRGGEANLAPSLRALDLPDATFFAYLVGACELIGGLAVVLGYPARTASVLLGLWCLAPGYDAHRGNVAEFLKDATMARGFFALATGGGGSIALFDGDPGGMFAWRP